jgi:hypothetical protein
MTTYTGRSGLAAVLRVKLMKVLNVPRIQHLHSDLHSQVDTSRAADLSYLEGTLLAEGRACLHPPE